MRGPSFSRVLRARDRNAGCMKPDLCGGDGLSIQPPGHDHPEHGDSRQQVADEEVHEGQGCRHAGQADE